MMRQGCFLLLLGCLVLAGCTTPPPNQVENICKIFYQYPRWYWTAESVERRWGTPVAVQMAIIHQESRFTADAKPARGRLLWVIPWFRPSNAYGYSQALKGTWRRYQRETGRHGASRDEFADAADFIGWFTHRAHREAGIPLNNARELYLAYHEGVHGYQRGTWQSKRWLQAVARKVQRRAWSYGWELQRCKTKIPKKPWWRLWR